MVGLLLVTPIVIAGRKVHQPVRAEHENADASSWHILESLQEMNPKNNIQYSIFEMVMWQPAQSTSLLRRSYMPEL